MSIWPAPLVEEIASKRVVVFLGAGVSATANSPGGDRPPDWRKLLETARDELVVETRDKEESTRLIDSGRLLDAAEVIFRNVNGASYSRFIDRQLVRPGFLFSKAHEIVRDLDVKYVVTTNYDTLYESACNVSSGGYTVRNYHDDNVLNAVRSPARLILKAHGCVTHPDKAVLTRTHYYNVRHMYPFFYALLDSLFSIHTVLFLGASLSDPDIQLVLENANIAIPCSHPHYALMPAGQHPTLKDVTKTAYNIETLEYEFNAKLNDHSDFLVKLEELGRDVEGFRKSVGAAV